MATIPPAGVIDSSIADPAIRDVIASVLEQLGLDEMGAMITPGELVGSVDGLPFVISTLDALPGTRPVIIGMLEPGSPPATVQVAAAASITMAVVGAADASSPNTPIVAVAATDTVVASDAAATAVRALAGTRAADTATGNAVLELFTAAVANQIDAAGDAAALVNTHIAGVDGNATIAIGGSSDAVAAITSHSGSHLKLDAPLAVLGGRFGHVTLADANDASVALVQFSGTVNGGSGSDSIQVGGATTATIAGGAGHDTFVFQSSGVTGSAAAPYLAFDATITDFTVGEDRIAFHFAGVSSFEDFVAILATVRQVGTDVVATTIMGDRLTLTGVELSDLTTDLFTFT